MVQNLNAKNVSGLSEPSCHILVLDAGIQIATGMIVGDDDGGSPFLHCFGEDLPLCVVNDTIKLFLLGIQKGCII